MLLDQKVEILFHTYIAGVHRSNDHIQAVIVENKAGRSAVRAKMFVDATGDADIAVFAGAPVREVDATDHHDVQYGRCQHCQGPGAPGNVGCT